MHFIETRMFGKILRWDSDLLLNKSVIRENIKSQERLQLEIENWFENVLFDNVDLIFQLITLIRETKFSNEESRQPM